VHVWVWVYADGGMIIGITVQGKSVSITTGSAALSAIDTGTTLIGGPTADVNTIWAAVPGSSPVANMQGFFSFRSFLPQRSLTQTLTRTHS